MKIRSSLGAVISALMILASACAFAQGEYFPGNETIAPDPKLSLKAAHEDWYKDQNFYHLWVASFSDSDGDGTGDIRGITQKLDYLKDLGISALWLSPFFKSNSNLSNLHGYDVTDHYQVDPRLGTNEDVKELLSQAHARGMRLIFDFVPNHLSNRHPWFEASRRGEDGKRDWFLWRQDVPEEGWTDWGGRSAWRSAGTDASGNSQYYYAIFWNGMPDLNYQNPQVRRAMADAALYWLNLGFDGIRMDAVRYLAEDPATGENGVKAVVPETITFFQEFRSAILDPFTALGYPKFMVAENWTSDKSSLREFMEKDGRKGFHMTLDFTFGSLVYKAARGAASSWASAAGMGFYMDGFMNSVASEGGWLGTFLNNHDNFASRPYTEFNARQEMVNLATVLQFTSPGTPFWYYGNEINMEGRNSGNDREFRTPMEWDRLVALQADRGSTWNTAKGLMNLRLNRDSLRRGTYQATASTHRDIKAFLRATEKEGTLVVLNLGREPAEGMITLPEGWSNPKILVPAHLRTAAVQGDLPTGPLASLEYRIYSLEKKMP